MGNPIPTLKVILILTIAVDMFWFGDRLLSIDGSPIRSDADVQQIASMQPGTQPTLVVEHAGTIETVHPTLSAWPKISY